MYPAFSYRDKKNVKTTKKEYEGKKLRGISLLSSSAELYSPAKVHFLSLTNSVPINIVIGN